MPTEDGSRDGMQGYWGLEGRNTPENGGRRELKTKHGLRVLGVGPVGVRRRGDGGIRRRRRVSGWGLAWGVRRGACVRRANAPSTGTMWEGGCCRR